MTIIFWILSGLVFYTYVGYALLLYVFSKILKKKIQSDTAYEPEVTLVVPCYNEKGILHNKIENCRNLDYPTSKLKIIFITDGSTDSSEKFLEKENGIIVLHESERLGKAAAENRAMKFVNTPIVIFTDANALMNTEAIRNMVRHFEDPKVGVVSGEKRIKSSEKDKASSAGEGLYWKYESYIKKLESDFYSVTSGAGELIAFRSSLYTTLEHDTVLDDFVQSIRIILAGYRNVYEPEAYATENASEDVKEEQKRKIRISAGSWQAMLRLGAALNPFNNFRLAWLYISHKIFRWVAVPFALIILLPLTSWLGYSQGGVYSILAITQVVVYMMVLAGKWFQEREIKVKIFFIPYYFTMTNWCQIQGFWRFLTVGQQSTWERSRRSGE